MIKLNLPSDRNKFTILWRDRNDRLVYYRYTCIVFGYVSSPFILQRIIQFHLRQYREDECFSTITKGIYVDNLFYTGNDPEHLHTLYRNIFDRMVEGGFELRSWASNSRCLADTFSQDDRSSPATTCEKLLGYKYFPEEDVIRVGELDSGTVDVLTKRKILSSASGLFDPLGLCLPVSVRSKILMKEIWKLGLAWDDPIPDHIRDKWLKIKADLELLSNLSFSRHCYEGNLSLYIFCDASMNQYGFTMYAKGASSSESYLLFAKSKSAPHPAKTLPTLELLAVYLAFKCLPSVLNAVKGCVTDITVASDSQVVLSWILSSKINRKNVFAQNRVKDIVKFHSDLSESYKLNVKFKYIATTSNPADLLTRGVSYSDLLCKFDFWTLGPEFLREVRVSWPQQPLNCLSVESQVMTMAAMPVPPTVETLIPVKKFSNVNKLFRVTALVFQFIHKLRRKSKSKLECRNDAKIYWFKKEQAKHFADEISFLNEPNASKVPNLVNNLNLFLDAAGLLRSRGRLDRAEHLNYDVKNPILLSRNSFLTSLLISDAHVQCKHMGLASTLSKLRMQGLWVPKGRAAVRSVIKDCITCKKINQFAYKYPVTTDLNPDRVNFSVPYKNVGIDFTGSIQIKLGGILQKMYILIFTCLNVRAIHLELLPDMSCESFLMAFCRFSNRYGCPQCVYSDNASTFLQALGILAESSSDNPFLEHLVRHGILHRKIPLYAAWVGAIYERQMRTLKNSLHKIIGRKQMHYFSFLTILSDIQENINNRPITYVTSENSLDFLTPNSFLKPFAGRTLLPNAEAGADVLLPSRQQLVQSLEHREEMLETIKERWLEEYLLSLRETSREVYQLDWQDKISVGDIVLISSPNKTRCFWQLGRVVELLPGPDKKTRTVKLVRPDRSEGVYPINLLYPMEIQADADANLINRDAVPIDNRSERPRRAAFQKCLESLRTSNL